MSGSEALVPIASSVGLTPMQAEALQLRHEELCRALAELRDLGRRSAESFWEIGTLLARVKREKLWTADALSLERQTFGEWVRERTGYSQDTAERLMKFSEHPRELVGGGALTLAAALSIDRVVAALPASEQADARQKAAGAVAAAGAKTAAGARLVAAHAVGAADPGEEEAEAIDVTPVRRALPPAAAPVRAELPPTLQACWVDPSSGAVLRRGVAAADRRDGCLIHVDVPGTDAVIVVELGAQPRAWVSER